ncbi:hypothetical protein BH686_01765 [Rhodococcus erythropolis]|nr:hypothetical protein BH686_01765 [Rhodococcus erythropolis]
MEPACNHVLFAPGSDFPADMPFWGRHQFVGPEPLLSIGTPALRQAYWQERISVRVTATSRQVPLFVLNGTRVLRTSLPGYARRNL